MDFKLLQEKIDEVISSIGSEGLLHFLQIISNPKRDGQSEVYEKKVYLLIINCVAVKYSIEPKKLIVANNITSRKSSKHVREREICYYLISKHLKFTVRQICDIFSRDVKNVHTGIKNMEYFIEGEKKPDKILVEDVKEIENQIVQFKAILKTNGTKEK